MIRPVVAATLALSLTAGCASVKARRERNERLTAQLDALRYRQPVDEVWAEVRRLLADRGFPLAGADARATGQREPMLSGVFSPARETFDPGNDLGLLQSWGVLGSRLSSGAVPAGRRALETGWRRSAGRYRADAFVDGSGVRIVFTRFDEVGGDERQGRPSRDLELELTLLRRLVPDQAERLDAALDRSAP